MRFLEQEFYMFDKRAFIMEEVWLSDHFEWRVQIFISDKSVLTGWRMVTGLFLGSGLTAYRMGLAFGDSWLAGEDSNPENVLLVSRTGPGSAAQKEGVSHAD